MTLCDLFKFGKGVRRAEWEGLTRLEGRGSREVKVEYVLPFVPSRSEEWSPIG